MISAATSLYAVWVVCQLVYLDEIGWQEFQFAWGVTGWFWCGTDYGVIYTLI